MKKNIKKIIPIVLITGYSLLVTGIARAAEWLGLVPCDNMCDVCDLFVLIKNIFDFLTLMAMPVAVIVLIYGGIMMVTSGGSEEKVRKGKTALGQAIWGLLIVFAAWLIVDTILRWLVAPAMLPKFWNKFPGC